MKVVLQCPHSKGVSSVVPGRTCHRHSSPNCAPIYGSDFYVDPGLSLVDKKKQKSVYTMFEMSAKTQVVCFNYK